MTAGLPYVFTRARAYEGNGEKRRHAPSRRQGGGSEIRGPGVHRPPRTKAITILSLTLAESFCAMKNPKLKVVGATGTNPLGPPATLGKAGAAQWQSIMSEYKIEDSGGRAVLLQICAAADDLAECDHAIARDGAMISTKNGLREHPLCKQRLALRAFICRSVQRLGLNLEPTKPIGRPPMKGYSGDLDEYEEDD